MKNYPAAPLLPRKMRKMRNWQWCWCASASGYFVALVDISS